MRRQSHARGAMRWNGTRWQRWNGKKWASALYSRDRLRLKVSDPLDREPEIGNAAREELLALAVEDQLTLYGAHLIHDGPRGMLLGYRRPVSHALHALLTVLTLGAWSIFWLMMCLGRTDDRLHLEVDSWGHVWGTHGKSV